MTWCWYLSVCNQVLPNGLSNMLGVVWAGLKPFRTGLEWTQLKFLCIVSNSEHFCKCIAITSRFPIPGTGVSGFEVLFSRHAHLCIAHVFAYWHAVWVLPLGKPGLNCTSEVAKYCGSDSCAPAGPLLPLSSCPLYLGTFLNQSPWLGLWHFLPCHEYNRAVCTKDPVHLISVQQCSESWIFGLQTPFSPLVLGCPDERGIMCFATGQLKFKSSLVDKGRSLAFGRWIESVTLHASVLEFVGWCQLWSLLIPCTADGYQGGKTLFRLWKSKSRCSSSNWCASTFWTFYQAT